MRQRFAVVRAFKNVKFYQKYPTDALGFINVILLHSDHRNVSATYVAIFRVVRRRILI
jgi:hypothetical protein